ncbi:MAG: hypothetical protein OFPII_34480 [Osedax symbiont Rs1]|nr:MAG: hypothetical protein OFPII_34480 [Osedax symbiont Rs1]
MNPFFIFLFFCTAVAIVYWFKNATTKQGITALKTLLALLILLLVALIVTGRLPIISGIPVLLLAIFRKFTLAKLLIPFIKLLAGSYTADTVARHSVNMNDEMAFKILGIQAPSSREKVVQAHRTLMRAAESKKSIDSLEIAKLNLAREHLINKYNT